MIKKKIEKIKEIEKEAVIIREIETNIKKRLKIRMVSNNYTKRKSNMTTKKELNTKRRSNKKKIRRKLLASLINHLIKWRRQSQIGSLEWKTLSDKMKYFN